MNNKTVLKIKIQIEALGDDGYHIFCKLKVNGIKCRALIDTGASKTVIGKPLHEKLNLTEFIADIDNSMTGIQPGGMSVVFASIEVISFGKMKFKNIITGLIDMEHVNKQYELLNIKPFDLILGGDILQRGNAVVDYGNKTLKLSQ